MTSERRRRHRRDSRERRDHDRAVSSSTHRYPSRRRCPSSSRPYEPQRQRSRGRYDDHADRRPHPSDAIRRPPACPPTRRPNPSRSYVSAVLPPAPTNNKPDDVVMTGTAMMTDVQKTLSQPKTDTARQQQQQQGYDGGPHYHGPPSSLSDDSEEEDGRHTVVSEDDEETFLEKRRLQRQALLQKYQEGCRGPEIQQEEAQVPADGDACSDPSSSDTSKIRSEDQHTTEEEDQPSSCSALVASYCDPVSPPASHDTEVVHPCESEPSRPATMSDGGNHDNENEEDAGSVHDGAHHPIVVTDGDEAQSSCRPLPSTDSPTKMTVQDADVQSASPSSEGDERKRDPQLPPPPSVPTDVAVVNPDDDTTTVIIPPPRPSNKLNANLSALQRRVQEERRRLRQFIIMQRENDQRRREAQNDGTEEDVVPSTPGPFEDTSPASFLEAEEEQQEEDDDIDMFAAVVPMAPVKRIRTVTKAHHRPASTTTLPVNLSLSENWDDADGYYLAAVGEELDGGRYTVVANLSGKGVFSSVVRCLDNTTNTTVAVKIIRNNDMMRRAAEKEVGILQRLNASDPDNRSHIVRLHRVFEYRGHVCLVFEWMWGNLRTALKKYGLSGGGGLNPQAVQSYARQLLTGLRYLRKNKILHADLKPDNILLNEKFGVLKICDLGSACEASDNEITSYLVSRFYRAPEIILGCRYDSAIDMWSAACTIYEIATGNVLFSGRSNNDMLKQFVEVKGKIPNKLIRAGQLTGPHFDDRLDLLWIDKDAYTKQDVIRTIRDCRLTRGITDTLLAQCTQADGSSAKAMALKTKLRQLGDLLDKCLALEPAKRLTPEEALQHPYITEPFPTKSSSSSTTTS